MKKRTIILTLLAFLFFYASLFLDDIACDIHGTNNQYFLDLKASSQNIMFEIFGDLEIAFMKVKNISTDEKKDLDAKLNKLLDLYNKGIKAKNPKDMSQCFYNFCYHAELIEYKIKYEVPYSKINEKYQEYISNFYSDLEFVKKMTE